MRPIRPRSDPSGNVDVPGYWLVCLERAVAEGNHEAAAAAQRELRRLGYEVTLRPTMREEVGLCQR